MAATRPIFVWTCLLVATGAAATAMANESAGGRYQRARQLENEGRLAEAVGLLPRDDDLPEAVLDDILRRRAMLQLKLGQCARARPVLLSLGQGGDGEAWYAAARCSMQMGDPHAAVQALERTFVGVDDVQRQIWLGDALLDSGNRDRAIETWLDVLRRAPAHAEAPVVENRLRALGHPPTFTWQERLERARLLSESRRHGDAVAELDAGAPPKAARDLASWLHTRGMALFKTRKRYPEAARVLARAAKLAGAMRAFDAFHAARALSRADRDGAAIVAYRRFAKRFPNSKFAAKAHYLAAWLELRQGRAMGARHMLAFVDGASSRDAPEERRAGLFDLGMYRYRKGHHRLAERMFQRYAEASRTTMVHARGLYWAGRAAESRGAKQASMRFYGAAVQVEALHWYGLLARARLVALGQEVPHPLPPPAASKTARLSVPLPVTTAFYADHGLFADAGQALREERQHVRMNAPDARSDEALASAYLQVHSASRARALAAKRHGAMLRDGLTDDNAWAWHASYARPHRDAVTPIAVAEGVPEALVYAVIRKESGFDSQVVSYADAIGLMQLIEPTARRVATGLGLEFQRQRLFDPIFNVQLGTRYLAELTTQFGGQPVLAIAAYNAGAHRVKPWLLRLADDRGKVPLDLWVENIPIEQTRNYVRRVVTNWARYRYLEDPTQPWGPPLPTELNAR